jgi:hypothetical protein
MNRALPIVIFDTGAHNRLAPEPRDKERIFIGIQSHYFFRLAGLSYEELVSTPDSGQRLAFLAESRESSPAETGHRVYIVVRGIC